MLLDSILLLGIKVEEYSSAADFSVFFKVFI